MVMREGIQDVRPMTKRYNTVDGDFLRRHQGCMEKPRLYFYICKCPICFDSGYAGLGVIMFIPANFHDIDLLNVTCLIR